MIPQTVHLQTPPAHEYVLSATFPSREAGPWSVAGFPSDWRLVVPANQDGISVFEVSSIVPAGTSSAALRRESHPGPGIPLMAYAFQPATLALRIDGVTYPLTAPAYHTGWHRRGLVHATARFHRQLGNRGHATYWVSARAGVPQLDVALLWHRAIPGPDLRFSSASFQTPGAIAEVEYDDPGLNGATITPGAIPQQLGRLFRFSIVMPGQSGERAHVGSGDWSIGGLLPAGLPVDYHPAVDYGPSLALERSRLAAGAPTPEWGDTPASPLWPACGVRSGAEGGGNDRLPLDGARWAASRGDPDAHAWYLVHQFRNLCRARIRLGPGGRALTLPAYGSWSFWDGFLAGQDDPWGWGAWTPWWGSGDPRAFQQHELFAGLRAWNENWALVWLANDPVARLLTMEAATRARLTFFEGPGPAHRLDVPPSSQAGLGSSIGGFEAVSALAIAAARSLGSGEYEQWRDTYLAHLHRIQMPSGCFTAREGGYPSDRAPFDDDHDGILEPSDNDGVGTYLLQGGAELAYTILAAYSLGDRDLARSAMRCVERLASDDEPGDIGFFYYAPVGIVGTQYRYPHRWLWPAELYDGMGEVGSGGYYTAFEFGTTVALAWTLGAPDRGELLRRFVETSDPVLGAAIIESWGMQAPSAQSSAPFEQYGALTGVLR